MPRTRSAARLAGLRDEIRDLPEELQLRILEALDDPSDCAALSLASPRLGRLALRSKVPTFTEPLFAIAMRLATGWRCQSRSA